MTLLVLSYLGGVLTILSPCVLPVLPFVFARADRPFASSTLPMLVGMAMTFAAVATLAAVGGGWVVRANEYGREAAMALLAAFGVMLLWPQLADRLMQPLVALGGRLSQSSGHERADASWAASFVLGVAVGFLWAPCAGPILGLILTGAALQGANVKTSLLLLTYALGAATSIALALLVGGEVLKALKRSLGAGEWVRRVLGVAVLAAVIAIAFGLDTGFLTRVSLSGTSQLEQALMEKADFENPKAHEATAGMVMTKDPAALEDAARAAGGQVPASEGDFPPLTGAVDWINSPPLTPLALRGKVVLVDFWTYSCINCLRSLPYVRAWARKYQGYGFVVIGVHTPEFAFEKNIDNVKRAVRDLKITYPVAVDNNYAIWSAFSNNYWPADYFIDDRGQIRGHAFGEGDYDTSERLIQTLLENAGVHAVPRDLVSVNGGGVEAPADEHDIRSPETYLGYEKAANLRSPEKVIRDRAGAYTAPNTLQLNEWALIGTWTVEPERVILAKAPGRISFRFHARDLHLVLGPAAGSKPVRYRVWLDGAAPGADHGVDTDAQGVGAVTEQRLYQLIRQTGAIRDRTFTIEFEESGAQAFSFTFG